MKLITDGEKRHKEICGIYLIINTKNNKKYIGQSVHIYERWREHYSEPCKTSLIDKAIQKYSKESFEVWLLEECEKDNLNNREEFYATQYPECYYPTGYNLNPCGKQNVINTNLKEVSCYNFDGEIIETFQSINEASRKYLIDDTNIGACCKGKIGSKTANGMFWAYGHEPKITIEKPKTGKYGGKTVYQYDKKTGQYIRSFYSLAEAERILNINGANKNISSACRGKIKTAYGFIWSYEHFDNIFNN